MAVLREHTEVGVMLTTIFGGQLPQSAFLHPTSRSTMSVSQACLAERVNEI